MAVILLTDHAHQIHSLIWVNEFGKHHQSILCIELSANRIKYMSQSIIFFDFDLSNLKEGESKVTPKQIRGVPTSSTPPEGWEVCPSQ
jgi:hypothetical protein